MNKKIPISLAIAIAIVAMTITFSITMIISMKMFDSTVSSVKEKELMYGKIAELDKRVRDSYYGDIDDQQLYDTMSAGYLAGLGDRYAKYYTAAQYATYQNQLSGRLMGIGVDVVKDANGYAKVIAVYADSPAAEAGLQRGSYLTSVDEFDLKALSLDAIRTLLQGEEGTVCTVGLLEADLTTQSTVELSRRTYQVPSVSAEQVGDTGYLRITAFNPNTPAEFDALLQPMLSAGITGLVLDVRGNSSTDIEDTVRVLDVLCQRTAIGSAVYKSGDSTSLGYTSNDTSVSVPIVLVANGGTAGASELFCVTLRTANNAKIVGTKTAGRGSIQTIVEMTDGSAVEFTVARMVPAVAENVFEGVGVLPDFEIALTTAEEAIAYDLTTANDPQILRALEMLDTLTGASTAGGSGAPGAAQPGTDNGQPPVAGDGTQLPEGEVPPAEGETPTDSGTPEGEGAADSTAADNSTADAADGTDTGAAADDSAADAADSTSDADSAADSDSTADSGEGDSAA